MDVLVFGSLNMDFVGFTNQLPVRGETMAVNDFSMVPGGKAANQAVASSRLGARAGMVGKIGKDYLGDLMKDGLTTENVLVDHVTVTSKSSTGVAMVTVDGHGQNTIVTYKGSNALLEKQDIDRAEDLLKHAEVTVLQLEMEQEVAEYIIQKAKDLGRKVVLNLAPVVPITKDILKKVDVLIVNETEASQLTNTDVTSIESAIIAAKQLQKNGIEHVIITLGEQGAVLQSETTFHYNAPKVPVIDSTAAGDCFVAAVATFWIETKDLSLAVKKAVHAAALSVTKKGAQTSLPTLNEVEAFMTKEG